MPYEDYNIIHLIHHIVNFSYTTSLPCKHKLDASNTLLLNYVAAMASLRNVATYVTIEHFNLDSYLTSSGCLLKNLQVDPSLGPTSSNNHDPRVDFTKSTKPIKFKIYLMLKWTKPHPTKLFHIPEACFTNRSRSEDRKVGSGRYSTIPPRSKLQQEGNTQDPQL